MHPSDRGRVQVDLYEVYSAQAGMCLQTRKARSQVNGQVSTFPTLSRECAQLSQGGVMAPHRARGATNPNSPIRRWAVLSRPWWRASVECEADKVSIYYGRPLEDYNSATRKRQRTTSLSAQTSLESTPAPQLPPPTATGSGAGAGAGAGPRADWLYGELSNSCY